MLEENATVVRTDNQYAWVEIDNSRGCSSCKQGGSCGVNFLSGLFGGRNTEPLQVSNKLQVRTGDRVSVGIPEQLLVRSALLMYLLPLLGLLAGAFAGHMAGLAWWPSGTDLLATAAGVAGFLLSIRQVKKAALNISRDDKQLPSVLRAL